MTSCADMIQQMDLAMATSTCFGQTYTLSTQPSTASSRPKRRHVCLEVCLVSCPIFQARLLLSTHTHTHTHMVLGEVSLWGEEINEYNLMSKAFPRTAAFAERMWSSREVSSPVEAAPRLARLVCRYNSMDIAASPISPGNCLPRFP